MFDASAYIEISVLRNLHCKSRLLNPKSQGGDRNIASGFCTKVPSQDKITTALLLTPVFVRIGSKYVIPTTQAQRTLGIIPNLKKSAKELLLIQECL